MTTQTRFKRSHLHLNHRFLVRRIASGWPWYAFMGISIAAILLLPGGHGQARFVATAERTYQYVTADADGNVAELYVAVGDRVEAGQPIGLVHLACNEGQDPVPCELTSTAAGYVAGIFRLAGDRLKAGDPVVRISEPSTRLVAAFAPVHQPANLAIGKECSVVTQTGNKTCHGRVLSISTVSPPKVQLDETMPVPLDRRIVVELTDAELPPGEPVMVVAQVSVMEQWFGM